ELRIQRGEFGAISADQAKILLILSRQVEEQQKFQEKTQKIKETLASAFEQGLEHGPKAFFKSLFDSFKQTIIKMESEWAASKVMELLFPTKSGSPASKQNPIQSVFDQLRNHGKPTSAVPVQHQISIGKIPDAAIAANTSKVINLTSSNVNL